MPRSSLQIVPMPANPSQRFDVLKLRMQEIQSETENLILQIQEIRKLKLDDKIKQALAKLQRKVRIQMLSNSMLEKILIRNGLLFL